VSQEYLLIAFNSTHAAIEAQKLLKELNPAVMPTLREISASCGISLRLEPDCAERATSLLDSAGVEGWNRYRVVSEGGRPSCTLIER
jgi:hypothetical protein